MQPFDYVKPNSLEEASALLIEHNGDARLMAGMTDLLIRIERGFFHPRLVVDVKALPGMRDLLVVRNGDLRIGAAVTMNEVALSPTARSGWPLLAEGCQSVASYQLRNRATVGGNVCNASPAADSVPALLCYEASVHIFGTDGDRTLPLADVVGIGRPIRKNRNLGRPGFGVDPHHASHRPLGGGDIGRAVAEIPAIEARLATQQGQRGGSGMARSCASTSWFSCSCSWQRSRRPSSQSS